MPAYYIGEHKITNAAVFEAYLRQVVPMIERHGGRYLTRAGTHEVLEGDWRPNRVVIIEFPDMAAIMNLADAVAGTIELETVDKTYRLGPSPATLMVRPRGWHLPEKHLEIAGAPASGSLVDFGLFVFHNQGFTGHDPLPWKVPIGAGAATEYCFIYPPSGQALAIARL